MHYGNGVKLDGLVKYCGNDAASIHDRPFLSPAHSMLIRRGLPAAAINSKAARRLYRCKMLSIPRARSPVSSAGSALWHPRQSCIV